MVLTTAWARACVACGMCGLSVYQTQMSLKHCLTCASHCFPHSSSAPQEPRREEGAATPPPPSPPVAHPSTPSNTDASQEPAKQGERRSAYGIRGTAAMLVLMRACGGVCGGWVAGGLRGLCYCLFRYGCEYTLTLYCSIVVRETSLRGSRVHARTEINRD